MPEKYEFLKPDSLSPFLNVFCKLLLTFFCIGSETDSSAPSESRKINGVELPVGVQVIEVLVELRNTTSKAVNHHKGQTFLFVNKLVMLVWFKDNCVDVCIRSNWNVQILVA